MDGRTAEFVAYVVAFLVLVVGGMFLRTMILNYFVGPMLVVIIVMVVTPLLTRRSQP